MSPFEIVLTAEQFERADRLAGFRLSRLGHFAIDGRTLWAAVNWSTDGARFCSWIRVVG